MRLRLVPLFRPSLTSMISSRLLLQQGFAVLTHFLGLLLVAVLLPLSLGVQSVKALSDVDGSTSHSFVADAVRRVAPAVVRRGLSTSNELPGCGEG